MKWDKAARDKLPADQFAGPGRTFPIATQEDVDNAARLVGHAADPAAVKAAIIRIAKKLGLDIPDAWKEKSAAGSASHSCFSQVVALSDSDNPITAGLPEDQWITRRGLVFEAGDYDDKRFSLSPEEMLAAVAEFQPVPLSIEHIPTVLDNKLGRLASVMIDPDDPWRMLGTAELPKWLDDLLEAGERKVSCNWDRATKRITELALVRSPRVADAALLSAFAQFAGQRHSAGDLKDLQAIHDLATKQGAACDPPSTGSGAAAMTTKGSRAPMNEQQTTTTPPQPGASAESKSTGRFAAFLRWVSGEGSDDTAPFGGAPEQRAATAEELSKLQKFAQENGIPLSALAGSPAPGSAATMSAASHQGTSAQGSPTSSSRPLPLSSGADLTEVQTLRAQVDKLQRESAERLEKAMSESAAAFADGEIRGLRALPAARDLLVAQYLQAARDDNAVGLVSFSKADGSTVQVSRVAILKARAEAVPPHTLTTEQVTTKREIAPEDINALFGVGVITNPATTPGMRTEQQAGLGQATPDGFLPDGSPAPMTDARFKALMAKTAIGRAAMSNGATSLTNPA